MKKAVLFDLDGTLVDAKEWHYRALNRALELYGYTIDRQSHETTYDGLPTRVKLEILEKSLGFPKELHNLISFLKQRFTLEEIKENCIPQENVVGTLQALKEEGYLLGMCSNSIRETLTLMLDKSNTLQFFDVILSNQDVQNPKPHPEIYKLAAEQLNVLPEDCLVVEDNDKGIVAGRAAGMEVYRVSSPNDVLFENINKFL